MNNNTTTSDTTPNNTTTLNTFDDITFEPKSNKRFIVNIKLSNNNESLVPSYIIKSISRPACTKENDSWVWLPLYLTLYDPIELNISKELLTNKSEPLTITITMLGPVADVIETWKISNAFISHIDLDYLRLSNENEPHEPLEIKLQIKYSNAEVL